MNLTLQKAQTDYHPAMVESIIQSVSVALDHAVIPNVTSTADVLSAMFTILNRMLRAAQELQSSEEREHNAGEMGRILSTMLLEFGTTGTSIN